MVVASLPILTFHALDDRPSVISFPAPLFRRAMAWLCGRGLRTLDLVEAVDWLERGVSFLLLLQLLARNFVPWRAEREI